MHTVIIRLNVAAFIRFLAFPMRRLFKGGVYFKITFFKSLKTVGSISRRPPQTAFVEREEIRAPLKRPAWEATVSRVRSLILPEERRLDA